MSIDFDPIEKIAREAASIDCNDERAKFVGNACRHNPRQIEQVHRQVAALLRRSKDTCPTSCTHVDGENAEFSVNEDIDGYRILGKLGEGGFGEVYHAMQQKTQRAVALKVLKRGMDSKQILARFEIERQTLAMMDHKGIAKILNAGSTESGQPYFVMDLIKGDRITKFCDAHNYDLRQRVRLFVDVCHAIQHAHHKGVIHRDIKPSNILVSMGDQGAEPMVIDFGVAKATQAHGQTAVTKQYQVIGTPAYMSPEQAEMNDAGLDTRSDVYSLGVVLYELLCGCLPFHRNNIEQATVIEASRILREEEPPRPSQYFTIEETTAAERAERRGERTGVGMKKLLRGELDWIAMKCLERERSNRYETVGALAQDLQRYLDGEPVLARRSSTLYSAEKFVRKRWKVIGVSALVLASLGWAGLERYDAYQTDRDFSLMQDFVVLVDLIDTVPDLLDPPMEQRRLGIELWLERAVGPASRLERIQNKLDGLLKPVHGRSEKSSKLTESLIRFADADGTLAQVRGWQSRSPSEQDLRTAWDECIADLEKTHPTWTIHPQPRLLPTGRNVYGLWEFVDLSTGIAPPENGLVDVLTGVQYVLLGGGKFQMGCPAEEANPDGDDPDQAQEQELHPVRLTPFLVSKYEFTQAQAKRCGIKLTQISDLGPLKPVEGDWFMAYNICDQIGASMVSEAQWEYACRAGSSGPYAGPLDEMGFYNENADYKLQDIGRLRANAFGLYDMHGNAQEWVLDTWDPEFYSKPEALALNPVCRPQYYDLDSWSEAGADEEAVVRGGTARGQAPYCRSAHRYHNRKDIKQSGFRPCITNVVTIGKTDSQP